MKEIILTGGMIALVDDEDFSNLNQYTWHVLNNRYAINSNGILMHDMIMNPNLDLGKEVHHKNELGLNNQKFNLIICSRSEHNMTRQKKLGCKSKYKGVIWDSKNEKWRVRVTKNYKTYRLQRFNNEIEAALAYNKLAYELFGEFARLNEI